MINIRSFVDFLSKDKHEQIKGDKKKKCFMMINMDNDKRTRSSLVRNCPH